jgi:phosphatidate cytidylyltransferase
MMSSLQKRLIISAILVTITIYTIFYAPDWLFFAIIEVFSLVGLHEFLNLAEKKHVHINRFLGIFLGALIPFSINAGTESITLAMVCLALFAFNFRPKGHDQALISTAVTVFGIIYVVWFFGHLLKIREFPNGPSWVFYTVLLVKGGDAGAYFVGRKYGKNKLIEHVSPNKSVEGSIGCLVTTVLLSFLSKIYLPHVHMRHFLAMGVALGILSQFGDLAESLMKRDAGVKDSGEVPGLGGILDVLDSLILTFPFVYYYLVTFIY